VCLVKRNKPAVACNHMVSEGRGINGNKLAGGAIVLTAMLCNSFSAVAQGEPACVYFHLTV
jgi:hypothetical protein